MKKFMLVLSVSLMLVGGASFAQHGPHHPHRPQPHQRLWHCTAYPQGHGHTFGVSGLPSYQYWTAYYSAMNRCERQTRHHCHDVHCHQH